MPCEILGKLEGDGTNPMGIVWGARNIAKVLGCSERTARDMIAKGSLPTTMLNGRHVTTIAALKAHIDTALSSTAA